ncbi:hypothetical protein GCM10009613_16780 [Pseudonocardia kongjuensis]|uniref:Antitoxin HicB n=1 Tax=Pseudonocardia kongjuensis TaxID=102227 RepID=A0ABN1XP01_9PSEU
MTTQAIYKQCETRTGEGPVAAVSYTVNATLVDDEGWRGWHVEVPEIDRATQARTVAEIEVMARDLIEIMTGEDVAGLELDVHLALPAIVSERLAEVNRQRAAEAAARSAAARAAREAALGLKDHGLSVREIGKVLGVSRQRASRLTSK